MRETVRTAPTALLGSAVGAVLLFLLVGAYVLSGARVLSLLIGATP